MNGDSLRWEFIKENKKVRKQENKNSAKKATKIKRINSFSCCLTFLFFFYKFPPLSSYRNQLRVNWEWNVVHPVALNKQTLLVNCLGILRLDFHD